MRLSIGLFCFAEKYGDFEGARILKEGGYDCLDYGYFSAVADQALGDDYVDYAKKFRAHIDKIGIVCNQAHAPNVEGTVWDESNPSYAKVVRAMESAAIMGAEYIIVHPLRLGYYEERPVGIVNYNEKFYRSLQPYCKKFGIKIGIENIFFYDGWRKCERSILGMPEELNDIAHRLDERYFGICLDIGHTVFSGYYPHDLIAALDKGIVKCLHVHDNHMSGDNHLLPHTGVFCWRKIVQELKKHGYKGDFTYEIDNFFRRMPMEFMPQAIDFSVAIGRRFIEKLQTK